MSRLPFSALLVARAVSAVGTTMTVLAIPWFVLNSTGSAAQTGAVAACEAVGLVVSFVCAGPLVDYLRPRRASVLSDLLAAAVVALIPALVGLGALPLGMLAALAFVLGLTRAPGMNALTVLVPDLVELAGIRMEHANGLMDGVGRAATMAGPPVAGLLVAAIGAAHVLYVDAASFLLSAALIQCAVPRSNAPAGTFGLRSYLAQQGEALSFIRRERLALALILMVAGTNALDAGWNAVALPYYATNVLHSSLALGLLGSALGAAALGGALFYGWLGPRLPRRRTFTLSFFFGGAPRYLVYLLQPALPLLAAGTFVFSIGYGLLNPIIDTVAYERIPAELRARVFAVISAGVLVCAPLGSLVCGVLIEQVGWFATTIVWAVLYLAASACPVVFPAWRQLDAPLARELARNG
jgi:MFS family permease